MAMIPSWDGLNLESVGAGTRGILFPPSSDARTGTLSVAIRRPDGVVFMLSVSLLWSLISSNSGEFLMLSKLPLRFFASLRCTSSRLMRGLRGLPEGDPPRLDTGEGLPDRGCKGETPRLGGGKGDAPRLVSGNGEVPLLLLGEPFIFPPRLGGGMPS